MTQKVSCGLCKKEQQALIRAVTNAGTYFVCFDCYKGIEEDTNRFMIKNQRMPKPGEKVNLDADEKVS